MSKLIPRNRQISALFSAAALLCTSAAHANIVPVTDMERGIVMTPAQCAALPMTVWVQAFGRSVCMRYYLSTAGGEGQKPLVYLQGDRIGSIMADGTWKPSPNNYNDVDTDTFPLFADSLSKQTKTPAIYLARLGIDGSSGDHRYRGTVFELQITSAALDAIKQQYKYEGFHLIGQSGGSTLVGGLLALRTDIGCAVPGSGNLAKNILADRRTPDMQLVNAIAGAPVIARQSSARILLVTDPQDTRVPAKNQTPFMQALRNAGHQADQFMVEATDSLHHGVVQYARVVAADCIRGASTPEIAQDVQRMVEKTQARKNAPKDAPTVAANTAPLPVAASVAPAKPAAVTAARAGDRATFVISP